jgi:hypothetical protein
MLSRARLLTLILATCIIGAALPASAAAHAGEPCSRSKARVLASGAMGRVYTFGPIAPYGPLIGCLYRDGRGKELAQPTDLWYPPPVLDIAGPLVGLAAARTSEADGTGYVAVEVVDVRRRDPAYPPKLLIVWSRGVVGSLVVTRSGGVAFISCSFSDLGNWDQSIDGDPGPTCVKAGRSVNLVVKHDSTEPARPPADTHVIATSPNIDPTSLRRDGHRLSWIDNGRRHTATIR